MDSTDVTVMLASMQSGGLVVVVVAGTVEVVVVVGGGTVVVVAGVVVLLVVGDGTVVVVDGVVGAGWSTERLRTRCPLLSAIASPVGPSASPAAPQTAADVPGPPSLAGPHEPVPATVVMTPEVDTFRTRLTMSSGPLPAVSER